MARKMTVGKKIAWGFAALMLIMAALGTFSIYQMSQVASSSRTLAKEYAPGAKYATGVENNILNALFELRGYVYSHKESFLNSGKKNLEEAKGLLKDADTLAKEGKNLAAFKEAMNKAGGSLAEYEPMLAGLIELIGQSDKARKAIDDNAARFTESSGKLLKKYEQHRASDSASLSTLQNALNGTSLTSNLRDAVADMRYAALRSQSEQDPKSVLDSVETLKTTESIFEQLRKASDGEELKLVDEMQGLTKDSLRNAGMMADAMVKIAENNKKRAPMVENVVKSAAEAGSLSMEKTVKDAEGASSGLAFASSITLAGLLVAVFVGAMVAWFITHGISKSMNEIIHGLATAAEQISAASAEQSRGGQLLAQGASEQASSLEETSASLEQLSSMTNQNAQNTRMAKDKADKAREVSVQGQEAMDRLSSAIAKIKDSANQTATIIKSIDEIAFQTNLLALNAAVEAARAGDSGKGFAVVADEVRSLAQRSAEAAKNTGQLIQVSQNNAEHGVSVTDEVTKILQSITVESENVAQLITEVASASNEQTTGLGQINTAVSEMDKVTQSTAATAEESAAASEELSAQAKELNEIVSLLREMITGSRNDSQGLGKLEYGTKKNIKATGPLEWDHPVNKEFAAKKDVQRKQVNVHKKPAAAPQKQVAKREPRTENDIPASADDIFPL